MAETPTKPRSENTTQGEDAANANGAADTAAHAVTEAAAAAEESHPFETEPGDHAETPFEAYQHLDLLLTRLAKRLGTTKAALRIYDPFYCEGRMAAHLARLGFESVYNRNEDFYAVCAAGRCPEFDVLVTNPPFSGDHLDRIFGFAVRSNKPWCLLIPQYCGRKAFFLDWINHSRPRGCPRPAFLAPTRAPYVFTAPDRADVREMRARVPDAAAAGATGRQPAPAAGQAAAAAAAEEPAAAGRTAVAASLAALALSDPTAAAAAAGQQAQPDEAAAAADKAFQVAAGSFQCVWFFHLGERHHKPVVEWLQQQLEQRQQQQQEGGRDEAAGPAAGPGYVVVLSLQDVPQLMAAPKLSPAERRWRKKQAALAAAGVVLSGEQQQQEAQQRRGGRQQQDLGSGQQGRRRGQQQQSSEQQQQAVRVRKPPPPQRKPPPPAFSLLAELDADA